MSHSLIIGTTESGKTTIAKAIASRYRAMGVKIIVCDPLRDPGWPADFLTRDAHECLAIAKRSRSCAIFVDESRKAIDRFDSQLEEFTTILRHWGHKTHLLAQRAKQVSPTMRDQCTLLFGFRVSSADAKELADSFAKPELVELASLPQFECMHCSRFGPFRRLKVVPGTTSILDISPSATSA